jgi:hypothetical protein
MGLILPDRVVRDIRAERASEIERAIRTEVCAEFTRELKRIDPGLELVWWPPSANAPGFVPGRYHVVWHHPSNGLGSVEPLVDKTGGYREPDSSLFELVRGSDMWNDRLVRDKKRIREQALKAKEKREREELEQIEQEAGERWLAATRAQVSMNRDTPWSQNAAGKRGSRHR